MVDGLTRRIKFLQNSVTRCWDKTVNSYELMKSMADGGVHPDLTFAGLENAFRTLMTEANCGEPSTTHTLVHHVQKVLERKLPGGVWLTRRLRYRLTCRAGKLSSRLLG